MLGLMETQKKNIYLHKYKLVRLRGPCVWVGNDVGYRRCLLLLLTDTYDENNKQQESNDTDCTEPRTPHKVFRDRQLDRRLRRVFRVCIDSVDWHV